MSIRVLLTIAFLLALPLSAADSAQDWTAVVADQYRVTADVVYSTANGYDNKVDLYLPRNAEGPVPTVIYIHGGGWVGGSKESSILRLLPYMRLGMAALNVEYRLARNSLAPGAVADCRCLLRWLNVNAERYKLDTSKLVVTGHSAGGHLSLMTGMTDPASGLDYECSTGSPDAKIGVAAVVNWYGITDVADLLSGANMKSYAVRWLGSLADREAVAQRVSPLSYVRKGLPPILTIHGDADPTVPYQHALRLKKELDAKGIPNQLHTVKGGKHGGFKPEESKKIYAEIEQFLNKYGIL